MLEFNLVGKKGFNMKFIIKTVERLFNSSTYNLATDDKENMRLYGQDIDKIVSGGINDIGKIHKKYVKNYEPHDPQKREEEREIHRKEVGEKISGLQYKAKLAVLFRGSSYESRCITHNEMAELTELVAPHSKRGVVYAQRIIDASSEMKKFKTPIDPKQRSLLLNEMSQIDKKLKLPYIGQKIETFMSQTEPDRMIK
jgi:hypothetical protein